MQPRSAAVRQGDRCAPSVPVASAAPLSRQAKEALVYFGAVLSTLVCLMTLWIGWPTVKGPANDFLSFYTGAVLVGSGGLYSLEANQAVQREIAGASYDNLRFIRVPFHAALVKPLALLPYKDARLLFACLSVAGGIGLAWRLHSPWQLVAAVASFFPLCASIILGQDVVFLLLVCGASLALHRQRHECAAGFILSLCVVKFHLFLLVPVALARFKMWRFLAGGAAGSALWLGISTLMAGPAWFREYLSAVQSPLITPYPERMPNVYGIFSGPMVWAAALVILAVFAYALARCCDYETSFGIALATGVIFNGHSYVYDCAFFLPALVPAIRYGGKASRGFALFLLTPIPYVLLLWGYGFGVLIPGVVLGVVLAQARREGAGRRAKNG